MSRFSHLQFASCAGALALIGGGVALAQGNAAHPNFFGDNNTGWISIGTDYVGVPGGPQPVTYDPAHRYVPNGSGEQSTFRVADVNNSNLTDFAKAELKKSNDL